MRKTKENKNDLGNKIVSTVFDIVYQRSLMIPKESFEILKKRNSDVDIGEEDDENVITFIDDKENPLIFAYVWFGKVRYCAKDYYEICRVRYVFRDKCLSENFNKEKCENLVNDLEFGIFSQLSEMVKSGLKQDIERCYIRNQINGDAGVVKLYKDESYVKCLPALTSVCSVNQVEEDSDNLFDINYLKRHPECGAKLCKKCNARMVHNNDICAFCSIGEGQISLGSQNEKEKMLEMAVDFVEEQLTKMGDLITDSNPALDVTPNIFVMHDGEPCGVLVRSKEGASPLKLSLRNRFDMINMYYQLGYKPLLAPIEIVHNDGANENEYTFKMGTLEAINNDIVPDKKTKEYSIYVILKLLESYWRKDVSSIEPFCQNVYG